MYYYFTIIIYVLKMYVLLDIILLTKKNTKAQLTFAKTFLDYPQDFWQIFCGLMRQKLNFLEGVGPVTSGEKPTQHFIKRTSYQQSNTVLVVWWSRGALQLQDLDDLP